MSKPFFYRITAADLLDFATDPEGEGMTLLRFAKELQKGESDIEFIQSVIDEAKTFSDRKRAAANKRWSNKDKQTDAEDIQVDAVHSTAMPEAVTEAVTVTVTKEQPQPCGDDGKFYKMKELSALAVKYLGWRGNLSPGQAGQLRPLTEIFKADVDFGFNAAASANASSVAYVIKAAGNNIQTAKVDTTNFEKLLEASR